MDNFKKDMVAKSMLTNSAGICIITAYRLMDMKIGGLDGFAEAVCIAICLIFVGIVGYRSVRMYMLCFDEKKLEAAYIKSKDERNIQINEKTSGASFTVSLYAVCFGIIFSSFFSREVCLALICVLSVMAVCRVAFKIYYNKKY